MTEFYSSEGQEWESTTYFSANARRREARILTASKYGPRLVSIERCDLGQMFGLNLDLQQYQSNPYPPQEPTKEKIVTTGKALAQPVPPGPPTLHVEVTTVDTGERKDFFGHQARHVITTRIETPLDATKHYAQETVTDGWYIDLDTEISCEPWWSRNKKRVSYLTPDDAATARIEFVQKGKLETGMATESKTVAKSTYMLKDGTTKITTSKSREKLLDFMEGPLDAALFDVPAGFKKVERISWNQPEVERSPLSMGWQQLVLTVEDFFH